MMDNNSYTEQDRHFMTLAWRKRGKPWKLATIL
jgi:hypothetical protein